MALNDGVIFEERWYHDVDAGGNCCVPWCTYSTEVEGSRHRRVDDVMSEPGETSDKAEWMTDKNEPTTCKHEGEMAEPFCNLKRHQGDTMRPEARRNVTLNELRTILLNMLLSGADVALKDLDEYLQRHVSAVHALVKTSLELEGYSDECCIGCEEHGAKNDDPKYDRPDGKSRSRTEKLSQMIPPIEQLRKGRR